MGLRITALYAAPLGLVFLTLALLTIRARGRARIAIGTGEDRLLLRASRVHANFAEYVPMVLVLMTIAEGGGAGAGLLHATGLALLVGRVVHAWGVRQEPERLVFRQVGMSLTFLALVVASLAVVAVALS